MSKPYKVRYEYTLVVEEYEDKCVGYLGEPDKSNPFRAEAPTPLEAVRGVSELIKEWPLGASDRWLNGTPEGRDLQRELVFDPTKPNLGRPPPDEKPS